MKAWYAVKCKHYRELETDIALNVRGIETYLPQTRKDKRNTHNKNLHTEPLFPSYLFIHMNEGEDDFYVVDKTPGVIGTVKLTHREIDGEMYDYPTVVPDAIIEELKAREDEQGIHAVKYDYQKGDPIRIKSGPFHDVEALVTGTKDERVLALITILGKQQSIELNYGQVEPV